MRPGRRELRAVRTAHQAATRWGVPFYVYEGFVRVPGKRPRIYTRNGLAPRPRGAEQVAVCSSTGLVRVEGSWKGLVSEADVVAAGR